jgi:hypothetical protein
MYLVTNMGLHFAVQALSAREALITVVLAAEAQRPERRSLTEPHCEELGVCVAASVFEMSAEGVGLASRRQYVIHSPLSKARVAKQPRPASSPRLEGRMSTPLPMVAR